MKRLLFVPFAIVVSVATLLATSDQAGANVVPLENKPRISAARCTIAKGRIANITDTMKNVSERRNTTYANIRERAIARVSILKQKGYDTTKLSADLQTVNSQMAVYRSKSVQLFAALTTAEDTACGDGDGEFASALSNARTQLKSVRDASQTIHQTFRETIIPDIKAAASWLKNN